MGKSKKRTKTGGYEISPDIRRIIPLKNNYCYIADQNSRLHHLKRDSEAAIILLRSLNEETGGRIARQLEELGWEETLKELTVDNQS